MKNINKKVLPIIYILIISTTFGFIKNNNVIEVDLLRNGLITINNDYVKKENLCDSLCLHLLNHNYPGWSSPRNERELRKVVVSIASERSVPYEQYISISDEIEKAYLHAWNTISYKIYSSEFSSLTEKDKSTVLNMLPKVISEADPVLGK